MIACLQCNLEMRPSKTGMEFVSSVKDPSNGDHWPYQLFSGDAYKCPQCGCSIVFVQPTQSPIAEHWQNGFDGRAAKLPHIKDRI